MSDPLRAALENAADAMDIVRDGLAVQSTDAVAIGAESILRHAAREARAALAAPPPEAGLQVCVCGHGDEAHLMGWECRRCDCLQYAAFHVSPADPPTEPEAKR